MLSVFFEEMLFISGCGWGVGGENNKGEDVERSCDEMKNESGIYVEYIGFVREVDF